MQAAKIPKMLFYSIILDQWSLFFTIHKNHLLNYWFQGFPGGPGVRTLLPMQGTWVQSLVWELRSHKSCGMANKYSLKLNLKKY